MKFIRNKYILQNYFRNEVTSGPRSLSHGDGVSEGKRHEESTDAGNLPQWAFKQTLWTWALHKKILKN